MGFSSMRGVVLVGVVAVLLAPSVARGAGWLSPSVLSTPGERATEQQLATTPQGDAVSAWLAGGPPGRRQAA
jgi:hypothetical protein